MAFGDWDSFTFASAGTVTAALNVSDPIVGSGSLTQGQNTDASVNASVTTHLDSGFNRGLTKGRIRSIVRMDGNWVESAAFIDEIGFGIYYMSNNFDINNNTSDFYWAGMARPRNSAGELQAVIARSPNKVLHLLDWNPFASTDELINSHTPITGVVEGDTLPIQIEWNLDISGLGGMRHTMSIGNIGDTNFSNLTQIYDFVEAGPLTTSSIEGLGWTHQSTLNTANNGVSWDSTGVFQLV